MVLMHAVHAQAPQRAARWQLEVHLDGLIMGGRKDMLMQVLAHADKRCNTGHADSLVADLALYLSVHVLAFACNTGHPQHQHDHPL